MKFLKEYKTYQIYKIDDMEIASSDSGSSSILVDTRQKFRVDYLPKHHSFFQFYQVVLLSC
mgnify:CR=1 FL=1